MWLNLDERLHMTRGIQQWLLDTTVDLIESIKTMEPPSIELMANPDLWEWINRSPIAGTFQIPNKIAYTLMLEDTSE